MSTPKTSAAAIAMLDELRTKRLALVKKIDSGADRCRNLAVAAHLGDADAAEELREIEAEEATARASLKNLEIVICEVERSRDALVVREAVILESRNVAELNATIDGLLALDDEIDEALDHARALLAQRDEYKRTNSAILRRASAGKLPGSRNNEIADSILAYFDKSLNGFNAGRTYAAITRISDWDAKYFDKPSPRMIERGPRELSAFERTFRRALAPRGAPIELRQATRP